jgi:hypothetical protein
LRSAIISRANCEKLALHSTSGRLFNRIDLPGGHWMVAYGFHPEKVYLTNHGPMPWDEFRRGWASFVPRLIGMRRKGLVAVS